MFQTPTPYPFLFSSTANVIKTFVVASREFCTVRAIKNPPSFRIVDSESNNKHAAWESLYKIQQERRWTASVLAYFHTRDDPRGQIWGLQPEVMDRSVLDLC
ncbi:predicted protein [Sclerotinia sclerotiorum 1980 UF-70]|uniref:Uncharacterized protein n=1 Tax=Sclerotinia sclerotiorum (strain ATCC 18683 / 1980 / Ss-1) TaxID=665079 RepID=A7F0E1_SCLS1|nr:predicted protein [Sclerotinia sclerotiorum 1980 UF-70]EDN95183.1 predicted protein [Sclerotinia sclerotiorum 1980 UF-70]